MLDSEILRTASCLDVFVSAENSLQFSYLPVTVPVVCETEVRNYYKNCPLRRQKNYFSDTVFILYVVSLHNLANSYFCWGRQVHKLFIFS